MNYRTYNLIITIPLAILFIVFIVLGMRMQPLDGDLTRLGGFTENDFGWNAPQERFEERLYDLETSSIYKQYADIVVLGDSFSHHFPLSQWQNYLAQHTGLKIVSYHLDGFNIDDFLESPAYKNKPPKVFILETVERSFTHRGKQIGMDGDCQRRANPNFASPSLVVTPQNHPISAYKRETRFGIFQPNISTGVHYLKRKIKILFNKKSIRAYKLPLKKSALFSNKVSDQLLIYRDDILKLNKKEEAVRKALCQLTALQNTIQSNQETLFVTVLAPDKVTAYASILESDQYQNNSWYEMIVSANQLNIPPLQAAFESAIHNKVKDIYLPNDTHWSSAGQKIVGKTVYEYLLKHGVIIEK